MAWLTRLVAALAIAASSSRFVATALPQGYSDPDAFLAGNGSADPFTDFPAVLKTRQNDKVQLRILPLGASIMSGQGSPEHSGIRKWVRMALRNDGWDVNMVGRNQDGTDLVDKDHEAEPGAKIAKIRNNLAGSLPYKANIVMINAGTNNANSGEDMDKIYEIMLGTLNDIWNAPDMGNTCIILSTLLPGKFSTDSLSRKRSIDATYRRLVTENFEKKCIYLADMDPLVQNDFLDPNGPYWTDDIHPNNEGARRAAYVFYSAIHRALAAGKVKAAAEKEKDTTGCDKVFGNGIDAGGLTQHGWGHHDGIYYHDSENMGNKLEIESNWDRNQWRFARLFSRDYDDFVGWFEESPNQHRFGTWKNSADGQGNFRKIQDMNTQMYCIPRGLHFIDMNADGLDDAVCIDPDGNMYVSINKGNGSGDKPPDFTNLGLVKTSEGPQNRVKLADIDGDGRADYGVIRDGKVHFWRNGWVDDKPAYWQYLGIRSQIDSGRSGDDHALGVRFEDINGDGRDDSMWLDVSGKVITWTNTRSCAQGKEGDGLNVAWRQGFHAGESSGATHYGMWEWRADHEYDDLRSRIFFARIFGTKPAFGNLGVQDYVFVTPEKINDDKYRFKLWVFKNKGAGGTKVIADGNKYCNMIGPENGKRMDYVWTWSDGRMHLFTNAHKTKVSGDSFWGWNGEIWTPPQQLDRRDLHLADWDGDGDCDIIYVNPTTSQVRVWRNDYPKTKNWGNAFVEIGVSGLPTPCPYRRGIGYEDLAVRFADISGDGRADYLCFRKDGQIYGTLNRANGWEYLDQVKFADGKDRANLRFADVNGDGKDDMIWVDKFNGNGHVWYNEGPGNRGDNGGSAYHWRKINSPVYDGNHAGSCMYYPDLDGNGRADMHSIEGTWTNQAHTWFNPSCGLRDAEGDDAEGVVDPKLPVQPGNAIGSPGPGEPGSEDDCENLDDNDWRKVTCTNPYIKSHIDYEASERWNGLGVPDAWSAAQSYINCRYGSGKRDDKYSNIVSNFFHGPQAMHCDVWNADTNGCSGASLTCQDQPRSPVGFFILDSFKRIFGMNWSLYEAFGDVVSFLDIEALASDFGISPVEKGSNVPLAIILDSIIFAFGLVMGPMWNKVLVPKIGNQSGNGGAIKDTVNDIVKNSATLAKDIYALQNPVAQPKDEVGLQTAIRSVFTAMGTAWRNSTVEMNRILFDGSPSSVTKLGAFIENGQMLDRSIIEQTERNELQHRLQTVMAAFMIPLTWQLSPEIFWPIIIAENLACDQAPSKDWTGNTWHYMTSKAYNKRFCKDGKSFWLVSAKDYSKTCSNDDPVYCDAWDTPPGFDKLVDSKYGVSWEDLMEGSVNTWKANGSKNVQKKPAELTNELLDNILANEITTPDVFSIPICGIEEARNNWEEAFAGWVKPGPNFPCKD